MTARTITTRPRHYSKTSWAAGLLVLGGLAWSLWTLLVTAQVSRDAAKASIADAAPVQEAAELQRERAESQPPAPQKGPVVRVLEGIVRLPDGGPAGGATVVVHRARTAAPEWQSRELYRAITRPDGLFRFELTVRHGLLVEFWHESYAGDFLEVPELRDRLELDLVPGFQLSGLVRNNLGAPVGNARVAVESTLDERRRVAVATTTTSGGYVFDNLPAGPVRLVARHDRWQAVGRSVLVGENRDTELSFTNPAAAPMRGKVVTTGQVPIAGAILELVPTNGRLGLVDPIRDVSADDGTFLLTGLSRGPMVLLARHPEHGSLRRTISIGASPYETVLELPPRSAVSGRLVSEAEEADVGGVTLQLTDFMGELHFTATDAEGAFAFEDAVSPGRAAIRALGGNLAFSRSQSAELTVQVDEAARTEWNLAMNRPTVVRGRCVDGEGRPLANVFVHGRTQLTASRLIGADLASFIGSVGQEVALTLSSDSDARLLAVSGSDGTFEFTGQEPGQMLLRYELPAHASRTHRFIVPAAGTVGDVGDVVMSRGYRITGVVRQGRRPLAGATVSVVGEESQAATVTLTGGRFEVDDLMPGSYRVRARLPSMPAGHAEQTVTLTVDGRVPNIALELPPGRKVRGAVTGRDGQPVANALVTVRGAAGQPTVTDASGSFALELPDREVQLEVSTADRSHRTTVAVAPGEYDVPVRLDAPPTCTVVARVAGLPGRSRVPGVLLRIKRLAGNVSGDDRPRWVEVQNGELRWPLSPVGRCVVTVRAEGFAPFTVQHDFVANEEHDLGEILLERGARVRGRVVDGNGNPVANARVFVGTERDLDLFEPQVVTAADGTFEVGGVTSRSSAIVAYLAGYSPAARQLILPRDVLAKDRVELVLEPGAVISVAVRDAPGSGLVQLLRGARLLATAPLDDAGRAEFVDRGPGRYSVRLYGSEEPPEPVEVTRAGESVHVDL